MLHLKPIPLMNTMEKRELSQQFACRLKDAMLKAELSSSRSTSGVCVHTLAEITGYSVQICRRYLRGEAIPEPAMLVEIAKNLHVSPGWLMFGEPFASEGGNHRHVLINKSLLHYIFAHAAGLYQASPNGEEVSNFLCELINDISHINTNEEQSKKIIDLALSSIKHFTL